MPDVSTALRSARHDTWHGRTDDLPNPALPVIICRSVGSRVVDENAAHRRL